MDRDACLAKDFFDQTYTDVADMGIGIRIFWVPLTMNWCFAPEKGPENPSALNLWISSFRESADAI